MRKNGDARPVLPGQMPAMLSDDAPTPKDFNPVPLAKSLMREAQVAALGTLDRNTGHPLTTLTSVASDHDGAPLLLTSGLAAHTANMAADKRACVLLSRSGKGDPLAHPRLTVLGRVVMVEGAAREAARSRFLCRHPKAALYADFPDFRFWRLEVESGHLNGGFARAADLAAGDLLAPTSEEIRQSEQSILAHLNQDHAEALARMVRLAGAREGAWRAVALDCEGLDLALGEERTRVWFEAPVMDAEALRAALVSLARKARLTER